MLRDYIQKAMEENGELKEMLRQAEEAESRSTQ